MRSINIAQEEPLAVEPQDRRKPNLHFGILCPRAPLQAWQADCLYQLMAMDNVELSRLMVFGDELGRDHQPQGVVTFGELGWRLYRDGYVQRRSRLTQPVGIADCLPSLPMMPVELIEKEDACLLQEADVAAIRGCDLDFILYLGAHPLAGEVLQAAHYGVWMFCFGQGNRPSVLPPALAEIIRGEDTTAASLRRLGHSGQSTLLRQGCIHTIGESYVDNLDTISTIGVPWPAQVCVDILNGCASYLDGPCSPWPFTKVRAPHFVEMLGLLWAMAANQVCRLVNKFFFFPLWNVGIVEQPIEAFLTPNARPPVRWLPRSLPCTFWADPFALARGDGMDIYFEDFDYRTRKGRISAVTLRGESIAQHRVVIDVPYHLSYPYIFEHQGCAYCIPESGSAGEISLYRMESDSERWTKAAILVEGFTGADGTLFYYGDRWWLLAINVSHGRDGELHAWHAPHLLGPWEPHANNPIKNDVRSSRPAGTPFVYNGCLYRPAQDCSRSYGRRVVINCVHRLTPTEFEEEPVAMVEPEKKSPYPDGLHTLSAMGNMTLIDGQKNVFVATSWSMMVHGLKKRLMCIKYLFSH